MDVYCPMVPERENGAYDINHDVLHEEDPSIILYDVFVHHHPDGSVHVNVIEDISVHVQAMSLGLIVVIGFDVLMLIEFADASTATFP